MIRRPGIRNCQHFATCKASCLASSRHNGTSMSGMSESAGSLIAFGVQEANEMSPLISHGPVFVQSGAKRSIVIESLRSFRPLYLPLCRSPSASREPRRSRSSFYSHAGYGRPFHQSMFLLISPRWPPRDFIFSPRQRACIFPLHIINGRLARPWIQPWSFGARLQNSRKEQKGERREGIVAVIGP